MPVDDVARVRLDRLEAEVEHLRRRSHKYGNTLQEHEAYIQGVTRANSENRRESFAIKICAASALLSSLTTVAVAFLR